MHILYINYTFLPKIIHSCYSDTRLVHCDLRRHDMFTEHTLLEKASAFPVLSRDVT
jgi:hypothetical protein